MARVRIKQLPITEKTLFSSLVNRNQTEIQDYSFIKDYTNLMKVSINDKKKIKDLTKQLSEGLQLPSEEVHEELSQAKTELQDLYKKLSQRDDYCKDFKAKLEKAEAKEKEYRVRIQELEESCEEEQKKYQMIILTLNEIVDKLDRTNEQYNVVAAEKDKLKQDVKSLQSDNALLFKKVVHLQDEVVSHYNEQSQGKCTCGQEETKESEESRELTKIEKIAEEFGKVVESTTHDEDYSNTFSYSIPSFASHKKDLDSCEVSAVAYNNRGTVIATGSAHGTLKLWDPFHGGEIKILKNFSSAVCTLSFSTDNQFLAACYVDRTIRVWKTNNWKLYNSFHGHSDLINCSTYSHTDDALVTGSADRKIKLWDLNRGICTKSYSGYSSCQDIDSLAYGSLMASGHQDGTVKFWTPNQKDYIEQIEPHGDPITSVCFTQDGRYLLTTSMDHTIKLIDVRQFEEISEFEHENYVNGNKTSRASIAPSGDYAVVGSKNGDVIILKLNTDEIQLEEIYRGEHSNCVNICQWQPNGGTFTTADMKGSFIIWQ
ncbi:unnamed protein product [Moneuplotes crassus]|uniref:Uncharacterized protein n=1 Tax=Euplotes crassus TaxID=5936 RepID=A0AAD1U931_EUPCR|nr:unnamed protein product [Moneuplotes crassus]